MLGVPYLVLFSRVCAHGSLFTSATLNQSTTFASNHELSSNSAEMKKIRAEIGISTHTLYGRNLSQCAPSEVNFTCPTCKPTMELCFGEEIKVAPNEKVLFLT